MLSTELRHILDGIHLHSVVIATYFMEMDASADVMARIRKVSSLIYPGAWTDTADETQEARDRYAARILGIYETPPYEIGLPSETQKRHFVVQIAVPLDDVGHSLASLLTLVGGEILAYGSMKLLDLYLPESYVARYQGPRFGVEGLRQLLNVDW